MSKEKQQQRKLNKIDRDLTRVEKTLTRLKERQIKLVAARGLLQSQLAPSAKDFAPGQQLTPPSGPPAVPPGQQKQDIELPILSWEQVQQCAAVIASDATHPKNADVTDLLARIQTYSDAASTLPEGPEKEEAIRLLNLAMAILTDICRWAVHNGQVNVALTNPEEKDDKSSWVPVLAVGVALVGAYLYFGKKK